MLNHDSDLHRSPQIRFLLFPRLHNPICCHSREQKRRRIRSNNCRDTCHNSNPYIGRLYNTEREHYRHGGYHRKDFCIIMLFNISTNLSISGSLLWRTSILPVQACTDVPAHNASETLLARPEITDEFRCYHYRPYCDNNHKRNHVCSEFQTRPEAIYCQPKSGERGREAEYDGDAQSHARAGAESDDY